MSDPVVCGYSGLSGMGGADNRCSICQFCAVFYESYFRCLQWLHRIYQMDSAHGDSHGDSVCLEKCMGSYSLAAESALQRTVLPFIQTKTFLLLLIRGRRQSIRETAFRDMPGTILSCIPQTRRASSFTRNIGNR